MTRVIALLCLAVSGRAAAAPCNELPVLFVVQDKSGSMLKDPTGAVATPTSPSKWSAAQGVVPALATQFTNRFRFGAMMFPSETSQFNCSTGSVTTSVSSDARSIGAAYSTATPGGGTSTAATLLAAKEYLLGLHLTTPAYVLLITDGLPNCNVSLNVNTCTASNARLRKQQMPPPPRCSRPTSSLRGRLRSTASRPPVVRSKPTPPGTRPNWRRC
jgi:Mg-chelatase subunit ChlD